MHIFMIVVFVAIAIFAAVAGAMAARKRREAMLLLAQRLGLRFDPNHDRGMASRYRFLDKLRSGSNRYAYNVLSGSYRGHDILAFDYHYETHSSDSKGRRQTHHHHFSFFILHMPKAFAELTVAKEGFFSKIAQAVGFDDIDFESHEFSRRFCVRSKNKKFAYDVCNARMIEYLLANQDLTLEIEGPALGLYFARRLRPEDIEHNLLRLIQVRELMPDYLFSEGV